MDIRLSIALVTRNRPDSLERWMQSIRAQTVQPFEILVSDDSSDEFADKVISICNDYNATYTKGPRRGLYANRNHAFSKVHGTHVLSADDDHTHPVDFLEKILNALKEDPKRIWILAEKEPNTSVFELVCPAEINHNGLAGKTPINVQDCMAISCGASVYPSTIFTEKRLFYPEVYGFGHIWYLWGLMLKRKNEHISFLSETYVIHNWRDTVEYTRARNKEFLASVIEANYFVALCFAMHFKKTFWLNSILILYGLRLVFLPATIEGYHISVRLKMYRFIRAYLRAAHLKNYVNLNDSAS